MVVQFYMVYIKQGWSITMVKMLIFSCGYTISGEDFKIFQGLLEQNWILFR